MRWYEWKKREECVRQEYAAEGKIINTDALNTT
jgi:hypothetical protein